MESYSRNDIKIRCQAEDKLVLPFDKTLLLGVIINEIITNSIKHGFKKGKEGEINIVASKQTEENTVTIEILDNGTGLKKIGEKQHKGLGTRIISALSTQIEADYKIENRAEGHGVRNELVIRRED